MSSEQKFNCIFCKDVFDSKEELQVHFRKHGDPKFNPKRKIRLPNESKMSGEKTSEKPEMVGCDVCSEEFPTISKAITHKHKVHPDHDAKYFCPWCGKLFTMKHLYNKHMQTNHSGTERPDDKDFHCDPCDVDFYIPSAVAYHNKFFHRQDTDLPDVGQSKKFKLHNQEVVALFYCAFCGEEYDNKINLLKHMTDDHSDENQSPDEVLRCPLCEAIFYHLDAYEIHITFHSADDLYTKKNEAYSDLQEFSLESLSPIVEKVENMEPQDDAETTINSVGIDKFLELAMDESQNTSIKSKKHKKHKKSKKSAITLDEFLSMNQDVFGEGLDFQGIEEVPTRVIAKRLKVNKKPLNTKTQMVTPVELEKLKQQGIVIKKKVTQNPSIHGIKVFKGVPSSGSMPKSIASNKVGLNTSDEVLSKLMSQTNSTIKIVKKSQENTIQESEFSEDGEDDYTNNINEELNNTSKPDTAEEDIRKDPSYTSNSTDDNDDVKIPSHDTQNSRLEGSSIQVTCHETATPMNKHEVYSDTENPAESKPEAIEVKSQNALKSLNTLQNIGQIVIKPKSSDIQTNKTQLTQYESDEENNANDNMPDSDDETNVDDARVVKNITVVSDPTNKSISVLKHLSHLITVKPVNQAQTAVSVDDIASGDTSDEEVLSSNQNIKTPIALPPPVEKEITVKPLKNVRHLITVKTGDQPQTTPSSVDDVATGDTSDEEVLTAKQTVKVPIALPPPVKKEFPVNPLKNLGHVVTVKLGNQELTSLSPADEIGTGDTSDEEMLSSKQNNKAIIALPSPVEKEIHIKQICNDNDPTRDALKSLSKNITIKSFPNPLKSAMSAEDNESDVDDMENEINKETYSKSVPNVNGSQNHAIKNIKYNKNQPKSTNSLNTPERSNAQGSPRIPKTIAANTDNSMKHNNADILKRLTNITTKPVSQKVEQIVCMPTIPKQIEPRQNEGEIEIFNIDDSDDDDDNNTSSKQIEPLSTSKPIVAFNHLHKNTKVQSINQQCIPRNIKIEKDIKSDEEHEDDLNTFTDESDDNINAVNIIKTKFMNSKTCSQKFSNRNMSITNALKNLGKNIIVKSRNSSPSLSMKSQDHSSQDSNLDANEASDSDSNSGKVKITEVNEYASDDEVNHDINVQHDTTKAIVKSPDDSGSDDNEDIADFENEIKANTLQKYENNDSNKNPMLVNTLRNLGKNITIKSLSEQTDNKEDKTSSNQENPDVPSSLTKQLAIKPFIQSTKDQTETVIASRSSNNVARAEHSTQSVNRKISSSNQVNTVNKEVTVKTFQTKTVIQEITTTVTKTIKTVNQTVKQEIRNSSQTNSTIATPRIQGMRQTQPQNLQGVLVRNASPRIGYPGPRVRPASTLIRPSKSLVPMRPGLNIARPTAPRMPIVRKPAPATRPQKHVIGKPLKISPSAIAMAQATAKRPNSEEMTGHFSCFKKPKESLIPVSEVPNLSGEFSAQHASTSHTSCSNFTSTTKVLKGNSVVTSTQMKSEMSASAQQISRLSNNSGLKIVKKSQAKEMQTQEKNETNSMKRTTLAAIEKLQKQGLLVKKPRLDVNEDSVNSEPDDENVGYSSDEEQNA